SRDITDFKTATDALLESEKQYHELFEANADALLVFDFDGTLLDVNLAACAIYGLAKEEFIGNSVLRMIQSEHHHILPTASEVLKSGNTFTTESKGIRNNVEPFPIEVRFSPVRYHGRMVVLAAVSDITERKQAQEKIAYFAHYDQITDLPNRAYFYELLNSSMARVKRRDQWLGLLYVDLDDFKPINDTYGHHAGDILLKLVAGRLISSLREVDVAARIGGDEFALILEELSGVSDANAVAVKVAEAIRQPYSIDGIEVSISASIGIAMYPSDGSDADVLLNCADKAMYRAKTAAKGL
ncbi:MAG: diguanylate cyclase, partial [Gammaproteobacteria bacterium]|nr:diguanylate cyclase [Gammaproteobacteria bacterium]